MCTYVHMINQTSRRLNKAKQIKSTRLRKSFFPKKNWLPQVGFEPTTLCSLDRVLCQLSHRGSSVDMGRISYTNTKQGKSDIHVRVRLWDYTWHASRYIHACTCALYTIYIEMKITEVLNPRCVAYDACTCVHWPKRVLHIG